MKLKATLAACALIASLPVAANVCEVPGEVLLTDPAGDDLIGAGPVSASLDLLQLSVATPPADSVEDQTYVFTLNVGGTAPGFPPGSGYFVSFLDPRKLVRGVRAEGSSSTPGVIDYFSYVVSTDNDGEQLGQFIEAGSQIPAEGSYAGGVVTITVKAKDLRIKDTGDALSAFNAGSILLVGTPDTASLSFNGDAMPEGLARDPEQQMVFSPCAKSLAVKNAELKGSSLLAGAPTLAMLLMLLPVALLRRRFTLR